MNDAGLATLRDELGSDNCLLRRLDVADRENCRLALAAQFVRLGAARAQCDCRIVTVLEKSPRLASRARMKM